jgi:hypothetical protein
MIIIVDLVEIALSPIVDMFLASSWIIKIKF